MLGLGWGIRLDGFVCGGVCRGGRGRGGGEGGGGLVIRQRRFGLSCGVRPRPRCHLG